MLKRRAPSPDAVRARRNRQRRKAGLRIFQIELSEPRLRAALKQAGRLEDNAATPGQIELALVQFIEDFFDRWVGPAK